MCDMRMLHGLSDAIKIFHTQRALADAIGVSHQTISNWKTLEQKPTLEQAIRIMIATKGEVSVYGLRYDLKPELDAMMPYLVCGVDSIQVSKKYSDEDNDMKKMFKKI